MQSAQVSVWVPIAVALVAGTLGILGVILGQVVNARRERIREDVKWQREQEKLATERADKTRADWRERRLHCYSEFLGELRSLSPEFGAFAILVVNEKTRPEVRERVLEILGTINARLDRLSDIYGMIEVVGGFDLVGEFDCVLTYLYEVVGGYEVGDLTRFHRNTIGEFNSLRDDLVVEIRNELHLDVPQRASQAPSSGPTS